jgi:hypothetical protein
MPDYPFADRQVQREVGIVEWRDDAGYNEQ